MRDEEMGYKKRRNGISGIEKTGIAKIYASSVVT